MVPLQSFNEAIDFLVDSGYVGFNVTVPFKEDAYKRVVLLTTSRGGQGVNTIRVDARANYLALIPMDLV